jgi:hypothetical protein
MSKIRRRTCAGLVLLLTGILCPACVHQEPSRLVNGETETWELRLSGNTEGSLAMTLRRARVQKNVDAIEGKFSGTITDDLGGTGPLICTFEGKIEGDMIRFRYKGVAHMAESVDVRGVFTGSISGSHGSGKWYVGHDKGKEAGNWTMQRRGPSSSQ